MKPYEPGYLANWPAEVYDIPMAEASLDARACGLAHYKNDLPNLITPVKLISMSSANMTIKILPPQPAPGMDDRAALQRPSTPNLDQRVEWGSEK